MDNKKSYIKFLRQYVGHEPILTAGVGLFIFNEKFENFIKTIDLIAK